MQKIISEIRKREGIIVKFKTAKIANAIEKTMIAIGKESETLPSELAQKVVFKLNSTYSPDHIPEVEQIQDLVEKVLIEEGHAEMAKAYILYRQKRAEIRKLKKNILGRMDDSKLTVNGLLIAKNRYLQKDKVIESPIEMFTRVAKAVAMAEKHYGKSEQEIKQIEDDFVEILTSLEFVPAGRILANAGTKQTMLYSSFVIPIEDSMEGIFKALYHKALIQRLGGGTGFSFSRIRPKGSKLMTTSGAASGPVAFIKLFDHASQLTIQQGNRKAANMGSLSVEHPDIIEFITMKDRREIKNFNISVEITDGFMQAVKHNTTYKLKDYTGEIFDTVDANNIFHLIVTMAWKTGDPGLLFIDKINEVNPLPGVGKIETTDPCGDQLLLPYDAGNLGAINLSRFVKNFKIQWKNLEFTTRLAVRFLDNLVDINKFPVKKIEEMVKGNRRIGLGVMGFADMLYKLNIPYNTDKALEIAEKVMKFISSVTVETSKELAAEKGVFPLWNKSIYYGKTKLRNCSLLAISPTGSRSILADCSPGIEPNFALGYIRKVLGTTEILHINTVLENVLKDNNIYSEDIIREIINSGSLENVNISDEIKKIFVTAYNISPEWHIKMQAVFQKYVDNAISKTVNFPKNATVEQIKNAFLLAYNLECRGITVYREGSISDQVISVGS